LRSNVAASASYVVVDGISSSVLVRMVLLWLRCYP